MSATAVREVLAAEAFAPLPSRLDEERPVRIGPSAQAVANVHDFVPSPREFTTRMGGLFLFIPDLVRLDIGAWAQAAKLPGSRMVPSAHALRASLALKLWAIERKSHIMAAAATIPIRLLVVPASCGFSHSAILSPTNLRLADRHVLPRLSLIGGSRRDCGRQLPVSVELSPHRQVQTRFA